MRIGPKAKRRGGYVVNTIPLYKPGFKAFILGNDAENVVGGIAFHILYSFLPLVSHARKNPLQFHVQLAAILFKLG